MTIEVRQMVIKSSIGELDKDKVEQGKTRAEAAVAEPGCEADQPPEDPRVDLEAEARTRYQFLQLLERSRER